MTQATPVEFVKRLVDGNAERCGNEVVVTVMPATGTFWQTTQPTSDAGAAWTTLLGIAGARFTSADASASPAAVITAPGGGLKAVITDVIVSSDTAMSADFSEESGSTLFTIYLPAGGGAQITPRSKLKLSTVTKCLMVQTSVAGNIAVTVLYYTEA